MCVFVIAVIQNTAKSQNVVEYNNKVLYHYTLLDNAIAKFERQI